MGLALPGNRKVFMTNWYSTFLIVANTSKKYTVKRAIDDDSAKYIEMAYEEILGMVNNKSPQGFLSTKNLETAIKSATKTAKLLSVFEVNQSVFDRIVNGNKNEKINKIIELVSANLVDAAFSMKRFEGIDEAYFSQTKENL